MISLMLMVALSQVFSTDIPHHFRYGEARVYVACLRNEVNNSNTPWDGPEPDAPTTVQFTQLMSYCGPERARAITELTYFIQVRHPDWTAEHINQSVEFVLSGLELELMLSRRQRPEVSVHDFPPAEF